jgi:transcriptional regulator with GAF, ATPase, and Fis domain
MNMDALQDVVLAIAQQRSVAGVLQQIVEQISDCPQAGFTKKTAACADIALVRIWLIEQGDICAVCHMRADCRDQSHCLHLAASAGKSCSNQEDWSRLDGRFRRFPIGNRKIGHIAATGEPIHITDMIGDSKWVANPEWAKAEGITTFAGHPLVFRGETLGVLGMFSRTSLREGDFERLQSFANHAAVVIANARAFEEIEFLKERLEEEVSYLKDEVSEVRGAGNLVGESPALKKVQQQIELVAPTQATVLITGESGTGKELVARAIHERSPRRERPLITVNCGAIPETLFESEFFGHARGAFTGAQRDKPGRFELASGGTLFLDEIGELPLPMQAKLLRVLQEQEVERVGETKARKIDVRVLAATNRDLAAEVEAGRFRQDLFYRLSVFPIENPPLRERREDIPRLAEHFIRVAAKRMNRKPPKFTPAAARQLSARDWPGNVRELQNAVERAVILSQGNPLLFEEPATPPRIQAAAPAPEASLLTRSDLKSRERENIATALAQTGGKIFGPDGAAALLGMKPTTLASRIKVLGLTRKQDG